MYMEIDYNNSFPVLEHEVYDTYFRIAGNRAPLTYKLLPVTANFVEI